MTPDIFMRRAIDMAEAAILHGQSPFGCVIVRDHRIIAAAHNQVWRDHDPTAHAEVVAIRRAAVKLGTINLAGCDLFSTCEPCPMCASAIHWANVSRVCFGASIADAAGVGFSELDIPIADLYAQGRSPVALLPRQLSAECAALFDRWKRLGRGRAY